MTNILNIETATTVCSVSVSQNGKCLAFMEVDNGYSHAENLHVFIQACLQKAGLEAGQLNAIAVSKGPGSYTGLRIGVSAAKGLAYALNIPLLSVDTLQVMAVAAKAAGLQQAFYCPMIDARRMEVYTCVYDADLNPLEPVNALILNEESIQKFKAYPGLCFFGDGMPKCKELLGDKLDEATFITNIVPSAVSMCGLSFDKFNANEFESTAYFEPFYLKDFMIGKTT